MAINIGINGFGRIGRLVFRSAINNDDFNVVSVNDLLDINHLAYLLKYDSVHGPFEGSVEVSENKLVINGKPIKITAERDPDNINWSEIGVDIVAIVAIVAIVQLSVKRRRDKTLPLSTFCHLFPFSRPKASQVDASLHHPPQSPEVVLVGLDILVEGRRHQALVGLHQVGACLIVGQGSLQERRLPQLQEAHGALTRRVR